MQCRSNDPDYMKTTVMKLPTDFVKLTESTPLRVSPVVAKKAHTDGTRVVKCQSDDQNYMKTTIMQMPMDFLEIPEPSLPRGFLELAEEARNVKVEIELDYTDEVQTHVTFSVLEKVIFWSCVLRPHPPPPHTVQLSKYCHDCEIFKFYYISLGPNSIKLTSIRECRKTRLAVADPGFGGRGGGCELS